jgi:dynein heavy chain
MYESYVPLAGTGGGVSRDDFIDSVAKDIIARIPPPYDVARTRKTYEMNLTPTIIVLLQELERFNLLLERMRETLSLLRKASIFCCYNDNFVVTEIYYT